jgi:hypothetical protein
MRLPNSLGAPAALAASPRVPLEAPHASRWVWSTHGYSASCGDQGDRRERSAGHVPGRGEGRIPDVFTDGPPPTVGGQETGKLALVPSMNEMERLASSMERLWKLQPWEKHLVGPNGEGNGDTCGSSRSKGRVGSNAQPQSGGGSTYPAESCLLETKLLPNLVVGVRSAAGRMQGRRRTPNDP